MLSYWVFGLLIHILPKVDQLKCAHPEFEQPVHAVKPKFLPLGSIPEVTEPSDSMSVGTFSTGRLGAHLPPPNDTNESQFNIPPQILSILVFLVQWIINIYPAETSPLAQLLGDIAADSAPSAQLPTPPLPPPPIAGPSSLLETLTSQAVPLTRQQALLSQCPAPLPRAPQRPARGKGKGKERATANEDFDITMGSNTDDDADAELDGIPTPIVKRNGHLRARQSGRKRAVAKNDFNVEFSYLYCMCTN